jgi:hypothetical protein
MDARAMSAGASNASQLVGYLVVVVGAGAIGLSTPSSCGWGCRRKGPHIAKPPDGLADGRRLVLPTRIGSDSVFVWPDWLERAVVDSWHCYRSLLNEFSASAGIRSVTSHEYLEVGGTPTPGWLQSLLAPSTICAAMCICRRPLRSRLEIPSNCD